MTPFQERIRGNLPALLTALNENFTVDVEGMKRITRRVIDHGGQGVVVVGTTGEFAGIDDDQRDIAIRAVVEEAAGALLSVCCVKKPTEYDLRFFRKLQRG